MSIHETAPVFCNKEKTRKDVNYNFIHQSYNLSSRYIITGYIKNHSSNTNKS